ncbi:autotransporter outer membrane beta-barrel domain-containing protein [Microvirga sp. W0021]|uniref:Autotransporter outer membrane beta-barrel domain-containing protein n=1 Tax=Hohaiivirga grylli TaxID=3133970 RepID=A0ABV0BHV9_9HYPH
MNNQSLRMERARASNFKYLCSVGFLAALVYGGTGSALAGQISVTDGTTITQNGGTFSNVAGTPLGAALYAANAGSLIKGTDLIIDADTFTTMATVRVVNGGVINLFGNTVIKGRGLHASGATSAISMEGGSITVNMNAVEVTSNANVTLKNVTIVDTIGTVGAIQVSNNSNLNITGGSITTQNTSRGINIYSGSTAYVDGTTITTSGSNASAIVNMQSGKSAIVTLDARNFTFNTFGSGSYGLDANSYGTSVLQNGSIHTRGQNANGIWAVGKSGVADAVQVTGDRLTIETEGTNAHGVLAQINGSVKLTNTDITVKSAFGVYADQIANITMDTGTIRLNGSGGSAVMTSMANSFVNLNNVTVSSDSYNVTGYNSYSRSVITVTNGSLTLTGSGNKGIFAQSQGTVNIENTNMQITGDGSVGMVFYGVTAPNNVTVTGGSLYVPKGLGIYAVGGTDTATLTNTSVTGDVLVGAEAYVSGATEAGSKLQINASGTKLSGAAYVDELSSSNLVLNSGSEWMLTDASVVDVPQSEVSTLTVNDSTIGFAAPANDRYQTLVIGAGVVDSSVTAVYTANNATLRLNTLLNEGGALSNQFTDRLLVNGDVAGMTTVVVNPVVGSRGGATSLDGNNQAAEGISIIQVSGNSTADSFKLHGGYVTALGTPYQYSLYAYGPGSVNGSADERQRLVSGTNPFWDYRLQSVYVEPVDPIDPVNPVDPGNPDKSGGGNTGGPSITTPKVRAVAPQVANYLIGPTALFHAGLQDIGNLHKRLGEIRDDRVTGRTGGKGEFFMRAYGGVYDYKSNRNAYSYGYDANIDYAAVQLGGSLYAFESKNSVTRFGVAASIGSLSFDPKNVRGTTSTKLDTWSVSAYGTYLHDSGWYVDGILSYGAFDGNVSTTYRGNTASLSGTSFSASLETGYPFQLGNGLVLEPQAQVIYQRLMFDRKFDTDMFTVSLGTLDQVTARVGARLSKTFAQPEQDRLITVYAKANVLHTFGSNNKVFLGDTFRIGDFGTSIEGGVGINATLSKNVSLYGEVSYQHRIGKSGVSGVSATGGLRYAF